MFSEFIVRGYEERSLGYKSDGVVIGGKAAYSFNFEIHFPFSEQGYALLFFDAGNGWRDPGTMKKEFGRYFKGKAPRMKRSFGIGVRLEIPMLGVIGIDLAYPLDALEKNIVPHFIMGTRF
jgi:outer membrane protein insertion porin family